MKIRCVSPFLAILMVLCLAAAAPAAEVSQGKTLQFDAAAKRIQIEEYDINFTPDHPYGQPTGIVSEYDLTGAKIGLGPEPGDVVRIAYRIDGERKLALKVMNVTKQDLRSK